MSKLRTLVTLPIAAATAFLVGTTPASAAPVPAAPAAATIEIMPSPFLNVYLEGTCRESPVKSFVTLQRIDWMWAPLPMDNPPVGDRGREPLPNVLIPKTMRVLGATAEWRARHDLVPGLIYTAPGRQPANQATCILLGQTVDGPVEIIVTGVVVTIPKWLDALLPPIQPPVKV